MPGVSIHVVDVSRGVVAAGMEVELHAVDAGGRLALIGLLDAPELSKTFAPGGYVAVFQVAGFYRAQGIALPAVPFLDVVRFHFGISDPAQHYHLPFKARRGATRASAGVPSGCEREQDAADGLPSPPPDVAPEPRAQLRQPRLVRHQGPIAAVDVGGGERLEARRRGNVAARGEGAAAALLLFRQIPGEIELGRVGVRRVLEDRGADQERRRGVALREHRLDRFARLLEPRRGRGGIEGRKLLALRRWRWTRWRARWSRRRASAPCICPCNPSRISPRSW